MRLHMLRQTVEHGLDVRLLVSRRGRDAEAAEPGGPLAIMREQPVHVAAGDQAVG